jgi:hypothetical protein
MIGIMNAQSSGLLSNKVLLEVYRLSIDARFDGGHNAASYRRRTALRPKSKLSIPANKAARARSTKPFFANTVMVAESTQTCSHSYCKFIFAALHRYTTLKLGQNAVKAKGYLSDTL